MTDLIDRIEGAEAGSRALDRAIWNALEFAHDGEPTKCPHYTTSLDAALALAELVLPGQEYEISTLYGVARVTLNLNHGDDGGPYYGSHECGSVPLALCAAILRAKEQGNGDG